MRRLLVPSVALLVVTAGSLVQAEELKSGLQIGDSTFFFLVNDCTGPNAGKSLCYRCAYGARPVVNVFAREITPEVADLIKKVDGKVQANGKKKMAAFVVHLTDDADASETKLKELAKKQEVKKTPLTNYDGLAGPVEYKIAKDADVTVMMWVKGKVKVNHVFKKGELTKKKVEAIVADTSKILN